MSGHPALDSLHLDSLPPGGPPDMKDLIATVELELEGRGAHANPMLVRYLNDREEIRKSIMAFLELENKF